MEDHILIIGGGVAGCAASIALVRAGRTVTLLEREQVPRHKVCGEFLSVEALADLHALGIDVASLGAEPIDRVRLAAHSRAAEATLPFHAASLTRKSLDTALITSAVRAGVRVEQGRSVASLGRHHANLWRAVLDDGSNREAAQILLATGKHDLRGYTRPRNRREWIAFKMYFRLSPTQTRELAHTSELMLFPGGYAGLQPVEDGMANLCCVVQKNNLPQAGDRWEGLLAKMQKACPHLAMRLAAAVPLLDRPLAISHIPYGYLRRTTESGLYCIGDQAAVIPSFTGDGISIALFTARCAAEAILRSESAPLFQARMRSSLLPQIRFAQLAVSTLNHSLARAALPVCLGIWPGVMRAAARRTRVPQQARETLQAKPLEVNVSQDLAMKVIPPTSRRPPITRPVFRGWTCILNNPK